MNLKVSIEYCRVWNYEPRAAGLADALAHRFGLQAELIPSSGGVFEVTVDGDLVFSKKALDRFPDPEEIFGAIESRLRPGP